MNEKLNDYGLSVFKVALTSILSLAGLLSAVYVALTTNELFSYFYCIATALFVALPLAMSVMFRSQHMLESARDAMLTGLFRKIKPPKAEWRTVMIKNRTAQLIFQTVYCTLGFVAS